MKCILLVFLLIGCTENEDMRLFQTSLSSSSHEDTRIPLSTQDINIVFDGNSLLLGATSSPDQYWATLTRDWLIPRSKSVTFNSFGIGGQRLYQMLENAPTKIDPLVDPAKTNIICVFEDANNTLSETGDARTGAETYSEMNQYVQGRYDAGYDYAIVISGYYNRFPNPYTQEGLDQQDIYFGMMNDGSIQLWNKTIDLRLAPNIGGPDGQPTGSSYFSDHIHLSDTGYQELSDYVINNWILKYFR